MEREYWLAQHLEEGQPWGAGEIKRIIVEMVVQVGCVVHERKLKVQVGKAHVLSCKLRGKGDYCHLEQ